MTTGAITIGRNVGLEPMPDGTWTQFIDEVSALITRCGGVVYIAGYGSGEWDGVAEESAVITFEGVEADDLTDGLVFLAAMYEQDAIALLTGVTVLVGGALARE